MTGRETWTVDRLHHALPHSALRQQLLQDVNLTPLDQLPAVLERWAAAAEQLQAAERRIESARSWAARGGSLPDGLAGEDRTADLLRDADPRDEHGRGAA
ncbi:hypothetical protein ACF053_29470 [Streptomyces kanasensis]|uniref:hypothetical protein n=1 Tax=Streptomyces kanasensis TaxID=936756 RepID=UPI003700FABC